jgi:hypothetical protein
MTGKHGAVLDLDKNGFCPALDKHVPIART